MDRSPSSSAEQAVASLFSTQLERVALFVDRDECWPERDAIGCIFDALRHIGVLAVFFPALRKRALSVKERALFRGACADAANYFAFAAAKVEPE
jgi:hypothetical protein